MKLEKQHVYKTRAEHELIQLNFVLRMTQDGVRMA
jgi:hypothetical protein